jgi:hypothetical protein
MRLRFRKKSNLPISIPNGTLLIALRDFLGQHLAYPILEYLSINRIVHLTATFLHNTLFYYDNKIYRFSKGSFESFSLTETLSNMYVYQWERLLIGELSRRNEFYGR